MNYISRNFQIWNQLSFCAGTVCDNIDAIYGFTPEKEASYICLVGVPMLIECQENDELKKVYSMASMIAMDGMPIVNRARRLGLVCDRFSGPDFMYPFIEKGLEAGKKHYFYGCTNDVLSKLVRNLQTRYPSIRICGTYSPPFRKLTDEEDESIIKMIADAKPDFLWVGLGGKKQDTWMYDHRTKITNCTMIGVGAAFCYIAGTLVEMPQWMEDHSLGWLFRLISEPRRLWRRYVLGGLKYIYYNIKYNCNAQTRDRIVKNNVLEK